MSVFLNYAATPARLVLTFEYIYSLGKYGGELNDILDQLEVKGAEKGSSSVIYSVINEMEAMKLVERDNEIVKLREEFLHLSSSTNDLKRNIYEVLLKKLTNKKEAKESSQEDVPLNIAIMLSMDPLDPISTVNKDHEKYWKKRESLLKKIDKTTSKVNSDVHFGNLKYWMQYLGFISLLDKNAIPDPTKAIERSLPYIFNSDNDLNINVFQKLLCERIPVFEGGEVRGDLDANTKEEYRRKDSHFSKSTSLALRRLENRGLVSFEDDSDYKDIRTFGIRGNFEKRISHIKFKKGFSG